MRSEEIQGIRALNTAQAARYLGLSPSYLEKSRVNQTNIPGPKFRKIGKRVIYTRESLDSWLDQFDEES